MKKRFIFAASIVIMLACCTTKKNSAVSSEVCAEESITLSHSSYISTPDSDLIVLSYISDSDSQDFHLDIHEGGLPRKFTINSNGEQIQFSQGNLQYHAWAETWRFALNQWDIIGEGNAKISDTYDGWIDLFGWGTGYYPTCSSYQGDYYYIFDDWGANKISNGGNTTNEWRTLTEDEWEYLIEERPNAKDLCGQGTVVGVHGLIVVPESWYTPAGLTWHGNPNNWTTNLYSEEEWLKMEKAGAVFLPCAGIRKGSDVSSVGEWGHYWSATPKPGEAYCLYFGMSAFGMNEWGERCYGQSIRLVR